MDKQDNLKHYVLKPSRSNDNEDDESETRLAMVVGDYTDYATCPPRPFGLF